MIALLGVLSLATVVSSPDLGRARLDVAAKQVQSDIEFAKQNAMLTQVRSGAQFTQGGSYTVYQNTVATPLENPLSKQSMVIALANTYPGITVSGNYTVVFDRFGYPTTGGGGSVTLTDGTNTRTVSVVRETGMVTLSGVGTLGCSCSFYRIVESVIPLIAGIQ